MTKQANAPSVFTLPEGVMVMNPEVLSPKKNEYQVLSGTRWEPEIICICGEAMTDAKCAKCKDAAFPELAPVFGPNNSPVIRDGKTLMKVVVKDVVYGPRRPAGDIVKTNADLTAHNGVLVRNDKGQIKRVKAGQDMFAPLDKNHSPHLGQLAIEQEMNQRLQAEKKKLLERMNRQQLQEYAESEGIPLNGAVKKEEILSILLSSEPALV